MALHYLPWLRLSFVERALQIELLHRQVHSTHRKDVVHYRQVQVVHLLLLAEALHLVQSIILGEEGLTVLLHMLLELGQNSKELPEFAGLNGFDHVFSIRSMKKEAPAFASAIFREHQLQLVEESLLKLVHSNGLHELLVCNPRLLSNALKHKGRVIFELTELEVLTIGSVGLQNVNDLEIVL